MTREEAEAILDLMRQPEYIAEWRDKLEKTLCDFELTYGMSTESMRKSVVLGELPETEEFLSWLMIDNRLQTLNQKYPKEV